MLARVQSASAATGHGWAFPLLLRWGRCCPPHGAGRRLELGCGRAQAQERVNRRIWVLEFRPSGALASVLAPVQEGRLPSAFGRWTAWVLAAYHHRPRLLQPQVQAEVGRPCCLQSEAPHPQPQAGGSLA